MAVQDGCAMRSEAVHVSVVGVAATAAPLLSTG
jgi:hypothetical protein